MQKTFNCEIEWNCDYVPYIVSWDLKECSLWPSVSGNEILKILNRWLSSVSGEDNASETYSFQAVCDVFNEKYQRKLFSVELGEGVVAYWTIVAEPYIIRIVDSEEIYGVKFIATEVG